MGERLKPIRHRILTAENRHPARPTVLIVQAHPDDLALGGGIQYQLKEKGIRVVVATITDGGEGRPQKFSRQQIVQIREWEDRKGCEVGGAVTDLYNLRLPHDGSLEAYIDVGVASLLQVVDRVNPGAILVTNWQDQHPDHRAAAQIVRRVAQAKSGIAIYGMGISTESNRDGNSLTVTHVVSISHEHEMLRQDAFRRHGSQIRRVSTPEEEVGLQEVFDMTRRNAALYGEGEEYAAVLVFDATVHNHDWLGELLPDSVRVLDNV